MSAIPLVNGQPATSVSVMDRGFQYGDGLYETIEVARGRTVFWGQHIQRLFVGCDRLGLHRPDQKLIRNEVEAIIPSDAQGALKIVLTRGIGDRGFMAPETPLPTRVVQFFDGVSKLQCASDLRMRLCATRLSQQPNLAGLKHLNQLERVLARREWTESTIQEGLMLDQDNRVIEGVMSNLFVVRDQTVLTPELKLCGIAGIIRDQILQICQQRQIAHRIGQLSLTDVEQADELFVTNSLIRVAGVTQFESIHYPFGDTTALLQAALNERIETDLSDPES